LIGPIDRSEGQRLRAAKAGDATRSERFALSLGAQLPQSLLDQTLHGMHQLVHASAEGAVEQGRRRDLQPQHLGLPVAEVEVGPRHLDVSRFPQAEVEDESRHVLGLFDQAGRGGVEALVGQGRALGAPVAQPHRVGAALVEELAGLVVALAGQQGVEGAAELVMENLQEQKELVVLGGAGDVVVVDDERGVVDGRAGVALRQGHRVQPRLLHARMPRRQKGLAHGGAPGDRGGRTGDNDARRTGREPRIFCFGTHFSHPGST
jgi:hypothetical protein